MSEQPRSWRFPAVFWTANLTELFERAAYYGTFIALQVFLTKAAGFSDIAAGWVGACFAGGIYLFPILTGAMADRLGFRPALALSFALLAAGYALLGLVPRQSVVLFALFLIAFGGSFVKPIITGTVSLCSDSATRARAFSLFYMIVNIGSFLGKTVAGPVRKQLGVGSVPLYSSGAAFIAFVIVVAFYRPSAGSTIGARGLAETMRGLKMVLGNFRLLSLILITAGFWLIQGQMYASMPKYVLRMVGDQATPEWYANVNPFVVVLLVVPITHLARKLSPVASIAVAMLLIPLSALVMSLSSFFPGQNAVSAIVAPVTLAMVTGIALQGVAECFLSPRYLEYASKQAPPGQEGLVMGYAYLNVCFAWFAGFALSGYLLDAFCPDPTTLSVADQAQRLAALAGNGTLPAAYASAHFIWIVFASIGATAFLFLLLFQAITRRADRLVPEG